MTDPWLLSSPSYRPGQPGLPGPGSLFETPFFDSNVITPMPASAGLPGDDFSGGSLPPELQSFLTSQPGVMADPMTTLRTLLGLPEQARDVQGIAQTGDPQSREELEAAIKELFAELNANGLPLEARPESKLAEAFATGDFSEITAEDIAALFQTLKKYQEQGAENAGAIASRPNTAMAPQGSWNGAGGNSYGGGTQTTGANSPATAPSGPAPVGPPPAGTDAGEHLAQAAEATANAMGSTGWCYKGVSQSVGNALGVPLTGGSAYMAADQLAGMPDKFQEVEVSPENLTELPPGAIVVWGKTSASPHGHISVALGDGREASDHVQNQITSLRGASNYRVFLPRDGAF